MQSGIFGSPELQRVYQQKYFFNKIVEVFLIFVPFVMLGTGKQLLSDTRELFAFNRQAGSKIAQYGLQFLLSDLLGVVRQRLFADSGDFVVNLAVSVRSGVGAIDRQMTERFARDIGRTLFSGVSHVFTLLMLSNWNCKRSGTGIEHPVVNANRHERCASWPLSQGIYGIL